MRAISANAAASRCSRSVASRGGSGKARAPSAATVDGASHLKIFRSIILPLAGPALASYAIFQFLWVWNDYLVSLIFIGSQPNVQVLTMRLAEIVGSRGNDWHLLTAGAFISMILPLAVFFSLQRYFVRGLLAGSVKG